MTERLNELDLNDIAYVTRSSLGNYTIWFVRRGNTTGHTLTSYDQLTDSEIIALRMLGVLVFDFKTSPDFIGELHKMEAAAKEFCY